MTVGKGPRSRGSARYGVQLPIGVVSGSGTAAPGTVLNLSRQGCLLSTLEHLAPGQSISLQFPPRDDQQIQATVAWSGDTIYGCSFATPLTEVAIDEIIRVGTVDTSKVALSEDFLEKLPQALLAARQASGYTTTELARHLQVSRPTLWAWESGRASPSGDNQKRLLVFLRRSNMREMDHGGGQFDTHNWTNASFQELIAASRRNLANQLGLDEDQIKISIKL